MELICNSEECTGCFACLNVCPGKAITVATDRLGKTIPKIDENLCVNCGLCKKVCPNVNDLQLKKPHMAIAAWSKREEDVKRCSSGGAATVFSRNILNANGVVFGAASINHHVEHIKIDNINDLGYLRGSKYVQSFTGNTYSEVKDILETGKKVLYIGVPCQISGLKSFLQHDYDNLITVDLICHGTPPFSYLDSYLNECNIKDWDTVSFRGENDWNLTVCKNGDIIYKCYRDEDYYFKAFLDGLSYRDNCYKCKYARIERISDITIGDFWGIERATMTNKYEGRISLILLSTEKGKKFWEECCDDFVWEERSISEAVNPLQTNLIRPSLPADGREKFMSYVMRSFTKAVKMTPLGKRLFLHRCKIRLKRIINI